MLNIYKASAGSGKTHTLSKEYIFLAFEKPKNFAGILAVTFTNKAAAEMKERIIDELNKLVKNPKKSDFCADLQQKFNFSEEQISNRAKLVLEAVLHYYTFFNISTIDSFVQKVIRSFTFEMQIPSSYSLELDQDLVNQNIANELVLDIDNNKFLQKWLVEYAFDKLDSGNSWDFRDAIINFSNELFKENFYEIFDKNIFSDSEFTDKSNQILNICNSIIKDYKLKVDEYKKSAVSIIKTLGLDNQKGKLLDAIKKFFFSNDYFYQPSESVKKAVIDGILPKKDEKDQNIIKLCDFTRQFLDFQNSNSKDFISARLVKKNIYSFGLINNLRNYLSVYRENNNILLIIDLAILLKKIIGDNDAPFIYEKIGNRFKNIMIDEFQDTSNLQWFNFKPLIQNSLADNQNNLIVGDIKQSIYRWRNGDWRLLHSVINEQIGSEQITNINLDTNWRSKLNLVNFNNNLFSVLPTILQQKLNEFFDEKFFDKKYNDILPKVYFDASQKTAPKNDKGGYVDIQFFENEFNESAEQAFCNLILRLLVGNESDDKKLNPGDVGILVRTNGEANKIMKILLKLNSELKENQRFNVISAESLLLSNSYAVRLIISCLRFIYKNYSDKNKEINKNSTSLIFLIEIIADFYRLKNLETEISFFEIKNIEDAKKFIPEGFFELLPEFANYTFFELIERIVRVFELNKFENEIPFLRSFQEEAAKYQNSKSASISGFLEHWEYISAKTSVQLSDVKNAVQIATIHKSKGLAYRVVVMPYIGWKLGSNEKTLMWVNTKDTPFSEVFNYLPININKDMINSHFAAEFCEETVLSYMDNLNVLYVAFTRAKEGIYGFAHKSKGGEGSGIGDYLYQSLAEIYQKEGKNSETLNFSFGEEIFEKKEEINVDSFKLSVYPAFDWTQNIQIVSHGDDFIAQTIETRKNAIKQGIIMHEIFSQINKVDDIENVVAQKSKKYKLSIDEVEFVKSKFEDIFKIPQVKDWFSDKWKSFAEKEILTRFGETFIPDRVISDDNTIIVIDYKFGKKRKEHHNQIRNYVKLLKDIYPKHQYKAFLFYIEDNLIEEVSFDAQLTIF